MKIINSGVYSIYNYYLYVIKKDLDKIYKEEQIKKINKTKETK